MKISSVCVHNLLVPSQTCCVQLCALWASYACTQTLQRISTFSTDYLRCLLDSITLDMLNPHSVTHVTCMHTQPASHYKPKTVSHKYTNHYFSILVCLCSQAPTQLSVSTASDGNLSEEGLEMRVRWTCVHTPLPFTKKGLHKCRQVWYHFQITKK